MTSQGTPRGRFQRAIHARHVQNAEMAAREMGGLSLADALMLCELLANTDPQRYERAALGGFSGSSTSGYRLLVRWLWRRRRSQNFATGADDSASKR
jgi:hypothetical protein